MMSNSHDRITGFPKVQGLGKPPRGGPAVREVVVTLTVTNVGLVPLGVIGEAGIEQVAAVGAPLHARETV